MLDEIEDAVDELDFQIKDRRSHKMKYGEVTGVTVHDVAADPADADMVGVSVTFRIDRSLLFEFMDALRPIDQRAVREPIAAILDHSAKESE